MGGRSTISHDAADFLLVRLELGGNGESNTSRSHAITSALHDSSFLVIQTSMLSLELQQRALKAASQFMESSVSASSPYSDTVMRHPSNPKAYTML